MTQQASARGKAKVCPACGQSYPYDVVNCPRDEMLLVAADPLIGQVLDGRYEVTEFIGQGGMSLVYKAHHKQLDRSVAIKLLKPEYLSEAANVQRFRREAKAASFLQHPNINAVYGVGVTANGQPYLVLEFLDGKSLASILAVEQPLELQRALRLFTQMLDGLAQAHLRGVIHRDLKPSNIVVTLDGDGHELVKIVDFGTAKFAPTVSGKQQQLTQAGQVLGTLLYMSPEQKRGQTVDARSDIYAVAYMLFEAVQKDNAAPESLQKIIAKGLEEDPNQRYQSCRQMMEALDPLMQHGIESVLVKTAKPARKPLSRRAIAVMSVCAALVAVLAGCWRISSNPVDSLAVQYLWLKVSGASNEKRALAAAHWADKLAESGDLVQAEKIYKADVMPLVRTLSAQTEGRLLLGFGRIVNRVGGEAVARGLCDRLAEMAAVAKQDGRTDDRAKLQQDRLLLLLSINTSEPVSAEKLSALRDIATNLKLRGFADDAQFAYETAAALAHGSPAFRNAEYQILDDWEDFCLEQGRRDDVIKLNDRLMAMIEADGQGFNPKNAHVLLARGNALSLDANSREADEAYRRAIDIMRPDHLLLGRAYLGLGELLKSRGRLRASTDYFDLALLEHEKHPLPKSDLCRLYTDMGESLRKQAMGREAFDCYKQAYAAGGEEAFFMPQCAPLAPGLLLCMDDAGQKDEVIELGRKVLAAGLARGVARDYGYWSIASRISFIMRSRGQAEEALKYSKIAYDLSVGGDRQSLMANNVGKAYELMGQRQEALQWYQKAADVAAVSTVSGFENAVNNQCDMGHTLCQLQRWDEAQKLSDKLCGELGQRIYQETFSRPIFLKLRILGHFKKKAEFEQYCVDAIAQRRALGLGQNERTRELEKMLEQLP